MNKKELADGLDIGDALNIADHLSQGYLDWSPEAEWVLRAQHSRIEELEADNSELKAYNTELHGIEHDLEMKLSELQTAVRSFFQDFLDVREESDSGRVFAPITISSCRCMMIEPLAEVLAKMRKLSGSEK